MVGSARLSLLASALAVTALAPLASISGCMLDMEGTAADEPLGDTGTVEDTGSVTIDTGPPDTGSEPDTTLTDTFVPDTTLTDTFVPDTTLTDTFVPDTTVTDTFKPDTFVPDTTVTDTFKPDTFVSDTFVPDTFVPDTFVPDTFVPDTFVPDTFVPDTSVTDTFVPDTASMPCTEANSGIYNGHCYWVVTSGASWTAARDACAAASTMPHPVHLATITTSGEWTFVTSLAATTGNGRWIGLWAPAGPTNDKTKFAWVTSESGSADKWAPGQPNGGGACVVQHSPTYAQPNTWEDVACTSSFLYLCERE